MKKTIRIVSIVTIGTLFLAGIVAYIMQKSGFKITLPEMRCFSSIDELAFLDEYAVKELDDNEINLKGLEKVSEYCMKIEYEHLSFIIDPFEEGKAGYSKVGL